jgi:anti-sigma B factor antagonist
MAPITLDLEKNASSNDSVAIYHAKGKLSMETVSRFIQQLRPDASAKLVLDLSGVSFLDSAGVGALVSLFVNRRNQGKVLALAALPAQAKAVVTVAGLHNMLPTYASLEEATNGKKT